MKTIKNLENIKKEQPALIIGAGSSIKTFKKSIIAFIDKSNSFTVGVNNITDYIIPDYHVFTNTQRFRTYGSKIDDQSIILLGQGINVKLKDEILNGRNYYLLNFIDKQGIPISYSNGKISGFFRTAGCLSIMLCHLMGASEINIVGMDGYTYFKKEDIDNQNKSQHCYGKGHTDTADWETCVKKDDLIYNALIGLENYGIKFKILTPTKYERFYDSSRLYN